MMGGVGTRADVEALTCFRGYDVRGRVGDEINPDVARRIGRAVSVVLGSRTVVVGRDCRVSGPALADGLIRGLVESGVDVIDIGQVGTEEVYFAVSHLRADAGVIVTASHNPEFDNGMKFVGPESRSLTTDEFARLRDVASDLSGHEAVDVKPGLRRVADCRSAYASAIRSLVDVAVLPRAKLVVNAGNGVAGAAFDAILDELNERGAKLDVRRIHHEPDGNFPSGVPNPLLPERRHDTVEAVQHDGADVGIAWDGDFDRCFLFDHTGTFVDGAYVAALLARAALNAEPGASIIHDPRIAWPTRSVCDTFGGKAVRALCGHAHIKRAMRGTGAAYGGEISGHHYFRDFMFCDSGMLPWLKVFEVMGRTGAPLADLVADLAAAHPVSGELNYRTTFNDAAVDAVRQQFAGRALSTDTFDGLTVTFADWRLNLRQSTTEPLLRLNIETRGDRDLLERQVRVVDGILRRAGCEPIGP